MTFLLIIISLNLKLHCFQTHVLMSIVGLIAKLQKRNVMFFLVNLNCTLYLLIQVKYYDRLSPLVPLDVPLGSFSKIRTGDCIVTFSRYEIYKMKVW